MASDQTALRARRAFERGEGILRLAPCWVPRVFLHPGRRLKLANTDLYALGAHRGGIDERWLSSCIPADNPGAPADEGLSYLVCDEAKLAKPAADQPRITLRDAVAALGADLVGREIWQKYARWPVYGKFFDNLGPIPHHLHQDDLLAGLVGREGKPEAYYFPPQLNHLENNFPYTFFGLEPGTTREDVRRCLERWNEGDNGILDLSKAYRLRPGTGWLVGPRILHAPGSLVTFEPQWASDVFSMFQSMVEGRAVPWELLVKDVPEDRRNDLDFLVDLLDWEANVDPEFKSHHFLEPKRAAGGVDAGFVDKWVVYGSFKCRVGSQTNPSTEGSQPITHEMRQLFTAKELTVDPGMTVVIRDGGCHGLVCVQGVGRIGTPGQSGRKLPLESPALIRFGEFTADEVFVAAGRAAEGVEFQNLSDTEPLVTLRYFGPDANPGAPELPSGP